MAAVLTTDVERALQDDGRVTSKGIHVSTEGSSVSLHGIVDSLDEFGIVQEVAESVPGVASVDNHLQIESEVNTGPCCPQM